MFLYHGTAKILLEDIRQDGLLPAIESGVEVWGEENIYINANGGEYVFLSNREETAASYANDAADRFEDFPVVLRVDVSGLPLEPDPVIGSAEFSQAVKQSIPSSRIEVKQGDSWEPLSP